MKIFIHAHYYLPKTLAGAEKFLHEIAKYLQANRHEVIISVDDDTEYFFEGIHVVTNKRDIEQHYTWADAIITHLNYAGAAIELGHKFNKPIIHLLHNNDPAHELFESPANNFIIYNSEYLRRELMLSLPSIVAYPPTDYTYWKNEVDHYYSKYITLVNVCREKGGLFLQTLADAMPEYKFLGVRGGYNEQIIQLNRHRNIQFLPQQPDMKFVYNTTRIIIMPSTYESWGMAASEAMASGIPVICSDTPGLRENCGDAAIYCEMRVQPYREAIESLADRDYYNELVTRGFRRSKPNDLHKILQFMEQQIIPGREPEEPKKKPYREDDTGEEEIILPYPNAEPDDDDDEEIKEKEERPAEIKEKQQIIKPGRARIIKKKNPVAEKNGQH
jgi:glycosyltransferase involved in cell wall biosynthesis